MFGQLGWAESVFVGLFAAFVVMAGLALYRVWKPLPAGANRNAADDLNPHELESDPPAGGGEAPDALRKRLREAIIDPDQLYIAEVSIGTYKLEEEHWLEIAFRFFNATSTHLRVESAEGSIECAVVVKSSLPDNLKFKLPPPVLLRDRSNIDDVPPFSESMIVLQQYLPPKVMEKVKAGLEGDGLQFLFDDLVVKITGAHDRTAVVILPITMGASLRQFSGLRSNRVHIARMSAVL